MNPGVRAQYVPLADLVLLKTGPFGSALHKADYVTGGVPVVNPMHISNGRIVPGERARVGQDDLQRLVEFRLLPGDVVLGRRGEMGRCAVVGLREAGWLCGTGSLILRPRGALEPRYLQRFLSSPAVVRRLEGKSVGSTMVNLNQGILRGLEIPIPPLAEQKRIADKLDALLASVDACRDRLDRVPGILKRFRQSVLAAAMTGELTREWREERIDGETAADAIRRAAPPEGKDTGRAAGVKARPGRHALSVGPCNRKLPTGWEWVPLARVAKLESGHTPSRAHASYWGGGIPWIGIKDARDHHGAIIERTMQTVSDDGLVNSAARLLPPRTVCLSRTASVGYVTIMGKAMATSQDFANWICTTALSPEYLMCALMAEGDGLRDFGEGTTHTTIYYPELKALHLALAPPSEQAEIVRRVSEMLNLADRIETSRAAANTSVSKLRLSLLATAFRGELVSQDPNEEPASQLLARLRTRPASEGHTRAAKRGSRRRTRERADTNMLTRKDVSLSHLTTILKERGALSAEALWAASQLEIDDFYDQLKDEEARGLLRENRGSPPNSPRLLEPAP